VLHGDLLSRVGLYARDAPLGLWRSPSIVLVNVNRPSPRPGISGVIRATRWPSGIRGGFNSTAKIIRKSSIPFSSLSHCRIGQASGDGRPRCLRPLPHLRACGDSHDGGVDPFLLPYCPEYAIDIQEPVTFSMIATPEFFLEFRYKLQRPWNRFPRSPEK